MADQRLIPIVAGSTDLSGHQFVADVVDATESLHIDGHGQSEAAGRRGLLVVVVVSTAALVGGVTGNVTNCRNGSHRVRSQGVIQGVHAVAQSSEKSGVGDGIGYLVLDSGDDELACITTREYENEGNGVKPSVSPPFPFFSLPFVLLTGGRVPVQPSM